MSIPSDEHVDDGIDPSVFDNESITYGGQEHKLGEIARDIQVAHRELDDYKKGSLALSQSLDEKIAEATINEDDDLQALLLDLKDAAYGIYLRLQYGDLELLGKRNPDSEHHGFFADE